MRPQVSQSPTLGAFAWRPVSRTAGSGDSRRTRSRRMMIVGLADQRGNAVEFFLRVVVDDDLPALGCFGSDQHGGAEPLVQMLFKLDQVGRPGLRGVCLIATDSRPSRGGDAGGHEGLGLADRQVLG